MARQNKGSIASPRRKDGRFTRCLNPVAIKVVVKEPQPYYAVPGRYGMAWEDMFEGLAIKAEYDPASMAIIRKMGGIEKLVNKMCPFLNDERRRRLIANIKSICHAKQREYDRVYGASLEDGHRARRLTKAERREKRKRR